MTKKHLAKEFKFVLISSSSSSYKRNTFIAINNKKQNDLMLNRRKVKYFENVVLMFVLNDVLF